MKPAVMLAASSRDLVVLAQTQAWVALVLLPVSMWTLVSMGLIRWRPVLAALWRPVVGCLAMAGGLTLLGHEWTGVYVLELVVEAPLGALIYLSTVFLLWYVAGRPESAEHLVLSQIQKRLARRKSGPTE